MALRCHFPSLFIYFPSAFFFFFFLLLFSIFFTSLLRFLLLLNVFYLPLASFTVLYCVFTSLQCLFYFPLQRLFQLFYLCSAVFCLSSAFLCLPSALSETSHCFVFGLILDTSEKIWLGNKHGNQFKCDEEKRWSNILDLTSLYVKELDLNTK